jgi:meiotically up-regulated gene 157 (Mug157) protein
MIRTDGGTGMMHEGVHVNDPTVFTREWFSWSNSMFCELALDLAGVSRDPGGDSPR